jgi:RHS repeat-associated protein
VHVTENGISIENAPVYVFTAAGAYLGINGYTDGAGMVQFLLPDNSFKFRVDYNGNQHWSDEIAIIPHEDNPIELDLALLALQLTNDPAPDRFDGAPPVFEKEPVLLASLFDIQGILVNSVVSNTGSGLQAYYFINDHLGTPQMVVDETGSVVWKGEYKPFGEVNVGTEDRVNNFRFAGQYYDAEIGLPYNWHRYYDPKTGRYLTPDPIGLAGGINLFGYVLNNPINKIDPLGLFDIYIFDSSSKNSSTYEAVVFVRGDNGELYSAYGSSWPNPTHSHPGIKEGTYDAVYRDKGHKGVNPGVRLKDGAAIPTLGPNPAQNNQSFSTGINIHCGDSSSNRGSAGCLTITPEECNEFFDVMSNGETGKVTIIRGPLVIGD